MFSIPGKGIVNIPSQFCSTLAEAKTYLYNQYEVNKERSFLKYKGLLITDEDAMLSPCGYYEVCLRLMGGKGGFGSMLRAMGSQIEKTTNIESCRDLNGRRIRDVNNEKKVVEMMKNKKENEKEKEKQKIAKLEKQLEKPKHFFKDKGYDKEMENIYKNVEDSVQKGFEALKRKQQEQKDQSAAKKMKVFTWMLDESSGSSSSSEDEKEEKIEDEKEKEEKIEDEKEEKIEDEKEEKIEDEKEEKIEDEKDKK